MKLNQCKCGKTYIPTMHKTFNHLCETCRRKELDKKNLVKRINRKKRDREHNNYDKYGKFIEGIA